MTHYEPLSAILRNPPEPKHSQDPLKEAKEYLSIAKWHRRFLKQADEAASWSKDPSRKVGAVIIRPDRTFVSLGYNGFARGVDDSEERYNDREVKLSLVVHAEENAIITAKESLEGYTLYCTLLPCSRCAGVIINAGIKRVVVWKNPDNPGDHTHKFDWTLTQFKEAQIEVVQLERVQPETYNQRLASSTQAMQ